MSLLEEYIARRGREPAGAGRVAVRILGRPRPPGAGRPPGGGAGRWPKPPAGASSRSTSASPTARARRSPAPRGCWPRTWRRAGSRPATIDEDAVSAPALHRGLARPRSAHPHLGRDADLELPPLAARLRRALRHSGPLARLHPAPPLRSHPRVSAARPPVRARPGLMDANLVRRVGFAAVAIPVALLVVWYGGLPLTLLLAAAAALGARELFDLAERGQVRPLRALGIGERGGGGAAGLRRPGRAGRPRAGGARLALRDRALAHRHAGLDAGGAPADGTPAGVGGGHRARRALHRRPARVSARRSGTAATSGGAGPARGWCSSRSW